MRGGFSGATDGNKAQGRKSPRVLLQGQQGLLKEFCMDTVGRDSLSVWGHQVVHMTRLLLKIVKPSRRFRAALMWARGRPLRHPLDGNRLLLLVRP